MEQSILTPSVLHDAILSEFNGHLVLRDAGRDPVMLLVGHRERAESSWR